MLTELQKELRRSCVGGSDAGSIVAGGEDAQKLNLIKRGRIEGDDLSGVLRVLLGSFTEPFNLDWCEKMTGRKVTRRGETVRHPDIPYLGGNLDGVTTTAAGMPAYIDAKHVGKAGDQLTLRYTASGTHYAVCLGFDWWCLSTLIGNSKWELTEQEVDPFFAAEYLEKCAEFWSYVEADKDMPMVAATPVPPPRKLRIVQLEDEFRADWPNWGPEMVDELGTFARTEAAAKVNAIAKTRIKELMPEDVGTVIRGRIKASRDKAGAVRTSLAKGKSDE